MIKEKGRPWMPLTLLAAPFLTLVLPVYSPLGSSWAFAVQVSLLGSGALLTGYAPVKSAWRWIGILLMLLALPIKGSLLMLDVFGVLMAVPFSGAVSIQGNMTAVWVFRALLWEVVSGVIILAYRKGRFPLGKIERSGGLYGTVFGVLLLMGVFLAWFTWSQRMRLETKPSSGLSAGVPGMIDDVYLSFAPGLMIGF